MLDEARNAVYYLDELHGDAVPHVLEELTAQLGRLGLALPVDGRPLASDSWIGGDRNDKPNVSVDSTEAVLALHHDHGIRAGGDRPATLGPVAVGADRRS